MKQLISEIITDAGKGDMCPLYGMIDWMMYEKNYPLSRVIKIAEKHFSIPERVTIDFIQCCYGINFKEFN